MFQIILIFFSKNSKKNSILNYPKSCAGKKKFNKKNCSVLNYSKKFFQKFKKKISVLNYPKSCAGKKKIQLKKKIAVFKIFLKKI